MLGRISFRFRRAAGSKGRIFVEDAHPGRKTWRAAEASRHREVLHNDRDLGQ
ncbi:MAG: hypothetical protein ACLP6E_14940 [Acidimicrobiales bacterium]